jgi:polyisoprenoid-binding protein YceI
VKPVFYFRVTGAQGRRRVDRTSGREVMLGIVSLLALAAAVSAGPDRFAVDAAKSSLTVRTGRAGLFKFAGHDHEIRALAMTGEVTADPDHLSASAVSLHVEAARLTVQPADEPPNDIPQVQARMVGPELLDVARFPEIVFHSTGITGRRTTDGSFDLGVDGDLSLHGVTRRINLHLHAVVEGESLTASGETAVRQTDFGMTPVSVAAGAVKVKDEVIVRFSIVARREPR